MHLPPGYDGNILVNAMTVGLARPTASSIRPPPDRAIRSSTSARRPAATASTAPPWRPTEFSEETEAKRPTVQIGDPFTEKLLIEACLELMATDAIIAIQDMGAAGLTSSSFEMAVEGRRRRRARPRQVPTRETGMTAYEIMLSESQERMLMVLRPGARGQARAVFEKWELDFAVVGRITDTRHMVVRHHGAVVVDVPIAPLVAAAPEYDRPRRPTPPRRCSTRARCRR